MSVIEHLEELRRRLIIAIAALAVGTTVGWIFYTSTFHLIAHPYCSVLHQLPKEVIPPTGCHFVFSGVVEPFLIRFKVSMFSGFARASSLPR